MGLVSTKNSHRLIRNEFEKYFLGQKNIREFFKRNVNRLLNTERAVNTNFFLHLVETLPIP